jgi:hypothetical protein
MYFQVVMDSRFRGNDKCRSGNDKLGGDDRKIKSAVFTQGMSFSPLAGLKRISRKKSQKAQNRICLNKGSSKGMLFDPVRSAGLTPVPSTGATGQAGQARYTLQK